VDTLTTAGITLALLGNVGPNDVPFAALEL
jgi:hypothetical protein